MGEEILPEYNWNGQIPSQGVKNALVVSWVYMYPFPIFKALTTYSVYKALKTC